MYDQLIENKVMTDGDGSEEPAVNSGRQEIRSPIYMDGSMENSERQSRRLYVITEESNSNIGGPAMSMEDY